jgi:hypothetical protein
MRRPVEVLSDLIFIFGGGHQFGGFFIRIQDIMLNNENYVKEYRYLQLCIQLKEVSQNPQAAEASLPDKHMNYPTSMQNSIQNKRTHTPTVFI